MGISFSSSGIHFGDDDKAAKRAANQAEIDAKRAAMRAWRQGGRIGPPPVAELISPGDEQEFSRRTEFFNTVQKIRNKGGSTGASSFSRAGQASPTGKATGGAFNNSILLSKNRTKTNILG